MKLTELKNINEGHLFDDPDFKHFTDRKDIVNWLREHTSPTVKASEIKTKPDGTTDLNVDFGNLRFDKLNGTFHKLPVKFGTVQLSGSDGDFDITNLGLHTLENCPTKIIGNFKASHNKLANLECAPQDVSGDFEVNSNRLTSLKGCPRFIKGDFGCLDNELTSLAGGPFIVEGIYDAQHNYILHLNTENVKTKDLWLNGNKLKDLNDFNEHENNINADEFEYVSVDRDFFKKGNVSVLPLLRFKYFKWDDFAKAHSIPTKATKILKKYAGKSDGVFDCQQEMIEAGFERYV